MEIRVRELCWLTVPERALRIIVPTFWGILKKYMKFDYITVGMVYPTQDDYRGLLSLSDGVFMKDIIIYMDNASYRMRYPEVISIIVKMAQCKDRGTCADHWN